MQEIIIENNKWETKLKLYETGIGCIENTKRNKLNRVFLSSSLTSELWDYFHKKDRKITISGVNWFTRLCMRLKLISIDVRYEDEE